MPVGALKFLIFAGLFLLLFAYEVYRLKSLKLAFKKHPTTIIIVLALFLIGLAYSRR